MDQREWSQLRETVLRRTRASGASREDAEDATHDALLAAIGQPEHPQSEVAWLSTVARRRRVDLIRQRVREQRVPASSPGASDPTAAGPEDVVVDRAHASWLAASLTQLPATTREVVDAVGSGMAPSEVASSMNLSARSVESHLTRARRHLRRMGALSIPVGAMLGWALRTRPGTRVAPAALAAAVPVVVVMVALLPGSKPMDGPSAASPAAPAAALPAQVKTIPAPASPLVPVAPATSSPEAAAEDVQPAAISETPGATGSSGGVDRAAESGSRPPSEGRSLPPEPCPLHLPIVGDLGCLVVNLVNGVGGGLLGSPSPLDAPRSER